MTKSSSLDGPPKKNKHIQQFNTHADQIIHYFFVIEHVHLFQYSFRNLCAYV